MPPAFKRILGASTLTLVCLTCIPASAAPRAASKAAPRNADDLAAFERKATLLKDLGATHVIVTEGLPLAWWKKGSDDPYPAWFLHHADLLTIFPPAKLQPFVDRASAADIRGVVEKRCAVLRRLGLKAQWNANEPAVLPEPFFAAYPELRGPRIDQANRSRGTYWAPNVDEPETLRLYREGMAALLASCPEVETFNWVTTDAGSGFDWTAALYPGENGKTEYRDRPIADRVAGFLINAQRAARDGGHEIRININPIAARQWMIPTFSPDVLENIVRKLPRGLAVSGREGPDGRVFATGMQRGFGNNAFYPVVGLATPSLDGLGDPAPAVDGRVLFNLGDAASTELNYRIAGATRAMPMRTLTERVAALRAFAVQEVGEGQADTLVEAWSALADVRANLDVLDFGGMLRFGHVLNRWVNRPAVPFPADLADAEKRDWRPFLFQSKGEEQASDLVDIQAMRMYEGWGARLLFQRTIELTIPRAQRAATLFAAIANAQADPAKRHAWELAGKRVQAMILLLRSADDMVGYQAQLDRVKALHVAPEPDPVLGVQSTWDRSDLMALARREIDTAVALKRLIDSTPEPLLDLAPSEAEETIMRLGPNLSAQLKHKVDTMNAHWRDYDRLFTVPNP